MKVVFDTNVLVAAFVSEGVCSKLLGRARRRQFQLFICPFILKEFERVLLEKLSATKEEARESLRVLAEAASSMVHPAEMAAGIGRDSDDDNILSCIKAAGADYLVSGDADLLELRKFHGTRIIAPRGFENLFQD